MRPDGSFVFETAPFEGQRCKLSHCLKKEGRSEVLGKKEKEDTSEG
jgi:hypothetical protein